MNRIAVAAMAACFFALPIGGSAAQTAPAPTTAPVCTVTKLRTGNNPDAVRLCRSPATLQNRQAGDPLSFYYGYVTATSLVSTTDVSNRRSLGRFLAGIFASQQFTAQVSLVLELQTSAGTVILPEQPLLIIQRKSDSEVEVANLAGGYDRTRLTPYLALDDGDPQVTARFRVRRVNDISLNVTELAQSAAGFAGSMGAEGWLITNLASGPLLDALSKSQAYTSNYFSDDVSVSVSAPMSFNALTTLTFDTGWEANTPATFGVSLQLEVRQSLVTNRPRVSTSVLSVPDVISPEYAPPAGTWADAIVIQPAAPGRPVRRLSSVLSGSGVPRRLEDLEIPASGSSQSAAARVGSACNDLVSALSSDEYFHLNRTDAALILYDELNDAGVFARYPPGQIQCVQNHMPLWKTRFGLSPASTLDREIEYEEMKPRLDSLGRAWKRDSAVERAAVADNFVSPLSVALPMNLYPDLAPFLTERDEGSGVGHLNAGALASRELSCFGGYQRRPRASATAFARFEGDPGPFVVSMDFVQQPGLGVLVRHLELRRMTAAEMAAHAQASCVAPPT